MNQSQFIKDKLIAMKEKGDKYDELLINYKNLEAKFQKEVLSLSSKLCNLRTEYLELQLNYKKIYEEFEGYEEYKNGTFQDKISRLYAENDDLKDVVYDQKNRIKLLNQEITNNENIIQEHQKYISSLAYANNSLLTSLEQFKETTFDLRIKTIQSDEIINSLGKENSRLIEENKKLKDSMKENDMIKSVIDELGISEWDIIDREEGEEGEEGEDDEDGADGEENDDDGSEEKEKQVEDNE